MSHYKPFVALTPYFLEELKSGCQALWEWCSYPVPHGAQDLAIPNNLAFVSPCRGDD
jgi:hypothetical protein